MVSRRRFTHGNAEVLLANAVVRFDKNGLYRLHNTDRNDASLEVFRGRALVTAEDFRSQLKTNQSIRLADGVGEPRIEKLDGPEFALLDEWTRVGDTGRRIGTLGQGDQAEEAVLSTKLECEARGTCHVPGPRWRFPRK